MTDNDRAIVIGSSVAGLVAARVLSEHFAQVVVIERDSPPTGPEPRKGVPQGRHTHAVLKGGADVLGDLFPGFWSQMLDAGTCYTDLAEDWVWFHHGVFKQRHTTGLYMYCQTRPLLEWHVRQRVVALGNVELRYDHTVAELVHDAARSRVTGVRLRARGQEQTTTLSAAVVVDTSGRGTQTPRWLEALGYGRPPQEAVKTNVGYASRLVKLADDPSRDWQCMLIYPRAPHQTRVGYIFPVEGGRHIMTLAGYCGDYPPSDEEGFLAFARDVPRPEYYREISRAEFLTPIATHRLPSNLRRRYERMDRFPEGLLVLGDAVCSFNPLFGQGMTTAALGANVLRRCLAGRSSSDPTARVQGLAKELWAGLRPINDVAWLLATTEDMRYPQVEGRRPLGIRALNWFKAQLLELSAVDVDIHTRFLEVLCFDRGLEVLMHPSVIARVLRWNLRPRDRERLRRFPRGPASASGAASVPQAAE